MGRRAKILSDRAVAHPWMPKGKKVYQVAYLDASGTLRQRTTGTSNLEDAKALLEQWKTEVYSGKKKQTFKYSEKQVNNIIDEAEADGRIGPKKAGEIRELPLEKRRVEIENWYDNEKAVKDGILEYVPKSLSTQGKYPWGDVPKEFKNSKDYLAAKASVRGKINRLIADGVDEVDLEEIYKLRDSVVNIRTPEDIVRWQNSFNEGYEPIRDRVSAAKPSKDWRATSSNSINKNTDDWIRATMKGGLYRYFKKHPDVIAGKISSSTLASQFMDGLSSVELRAWDEVLRPIKLMNDRWHQVALDSGDPKYLDKIVEAHHLMPIGYEGTGLRPTNIAGAQGSGFLPSTEHGAKHTPFAKLLYGDYADLGVTELHYTPEGTGDIKTKWTAPRWDAESKKVVYDWLPPEEWIHGTPEYKYDQRIDPFPDAGLHDKPQGLPGPPDPNKFGFFELFRRIARNPVVKVGVKALPFLGYGAGVYGAYDYGAEHPILSTISGVSAIPGVGDVLGAPLALAEGTGLAINWVNEQPTVYPRDPYSGMGRRQGLLGEGHSGLQDRSPMDTYGGRRRKNIWN